MAIRQLIQLDGTIANPKLPLLDVTAAEIAVAALTTVVYWPALGSWGANALDAGFLDRLTDETRSTLGSTAVSSHFVSGSDGKESYSLTASNRALHEPDFDTTGSFTVGVVHGVDLGFGGYAAADSWFVASNGAGKLRFAVGGLVTYGDYSDYAGPLINDGELHYTILVVDREAGIVSLEVDGQLAHSRTGVIGPIDPQLVFGRTNSSGTVQNRYGSYRGPIGFNQALAGDDMEALRAMLQELAG